MNSKILTFLILFGFIMISVITAGIITISNPEEDEIYNLGVLSEMTSYSDPFNIQIIKGTYLASKEDNVNLNLYIINSTNSAESLIQVEKMEDKENLIVSGGGSFATDLMVASARNNPEIQYITVDAIFDSSRSSTLPKNVLNLKFRSEEPSFIAGYVAGMMTKTNKIGFLAGMDANTIDTFYYGFKRGIDTAASNRGTKITLEKRTVGSFDNEEKGYNLTKEMYENGCDIAFMVAGTSGNGGIRAAKDLDKYVIGVDMDQNYLAPQNVIFSVVKKIETAVNTEIESYVSGKPFNTTEISLGYTEDSVGIENFLPCVPEIYQNAAYDFEILIKEGRIKIPTTKTEYDAFDSIWSAYS